VNNNLKMENQPTVQVPAVSARTRSQGLNWRSFAAWARAQVNEGNFWLWATLLVGGLSHCWNLFAYPYLENDEGLYSAQAYSVFNEGKLTPYTYWYDHPPLGWMQIGAFMKLVGLNTFGNAVNGGRVFISIVFLITCYFMFKLMVHLTGAWLKTMTMRYVAGFLAVSLMALSPLSIFFQRQVLLDNIMVAWVLAAFYILLVRYPKEYNMLELYGSGVALGIAVLTKEIAIVYVPVMLWLVWRVADHHHRRFAVFGWLFVTSSLVSGWFLYAFLKGELFPSGSFFSGGAKHVSIIDTLKFQAGRGTGLPFWAPGSDFRSNWETNWSTLDKFTPIIGVMGLVICLLVGLLFKSKRNLLIPVLPALVYSVFLLRGGIVLYYYILPLLPWLAMATVMAVSLLVAPLSRLKKPSAVRSTMVGTRLAAVALVVSLGMWQADSGYGERLLTGDQTYGQKLAHNYVLKNIPNDAVIVADDFFYLDLRQPENQALAKNNVHIYFKVDTDPEIGTDLLKDDWRNIDYMLVTLQQMQRDLQARSLPMLNEAYQHSHLVKSFPSREGWELQLRQIDPLEIKKVSFPLGQTVRPGQPFEITVNLASIKNKTLTNFNTLLEIRKDGKKVGQDVKIIDNLSTKNPQTVTFHWEVPADTAPGEYEINLGAFDSTWTQDFMWQVLKDRLTVTQ
jgi:4-amino-4-deoxy-L-arabinose transferase-like glycosyltransferase